MKYVRMPIEIEAPEQLGYHTIDCNLTESSYTDFKFKELGLKLDDLVIAYIDHMGHPGMRSLLSKDTDGRIPASNVLLTAGAAQALFIIATSLLESGDELVVVRPNYGTNLETPRAMGVNVKTVDLTFETQWQTEPEKIRAALTSKTRLVSITHPHNPTGATLSRAALQEIARLTGERGIPLLVDETYRDMCRSEKLPYAATLGDHVISVASLSKTYGLPGIRLGWLMCNHASWFEKFFAAKEQIQICGSALDEEIAFQFFSRRQEFLPGILANLDRRFSIVDQWISGHAELEWVRPSGGCVAFPRFRTLNPSQIEEFYRILNQDFSTHVGPGHWFEQSKRYFRLGFGWPDDAQLERGLKNIDRAIEKAHRGR